MPQICVIFFWKLFPRFDKFGPVFFDMYMLKKNRSKSLLFYYVSPCPCQQIDIKIETIGQYFETKFDKFAKSPFLTLPIFCTKTGRQNSKTIGRQMVHKVKGTSNFFQSSKYVLKTWLKFFLKKYKSILVSTTWPMLI
jgi:hypothetical protein